MTVAYTVYIRIGIYIYMAWYNTYNDVHVLSQNGIRAWQFVSRFNAQKSAKYC